MDTYGAISTDEGQEIVVPKPGGRGKEKIPMSKITSSPKFIRGDVVRVKLGVTDADFPDIPCGGWAGTIAQVKDGDPRTYLVQLNERTLNSIHPIYHKRCERDGLEASQVWMFAEELEPDVGQSVAIELPTAIVTEPLSMDDQDDRIRAVFGLTTDDPLPMVDDDSLLAYCQYLNTKLLFPFEANYSKETGRFSRHTRRVAVISLGDPDNPWIDDMYGIFCTARLAQPMVDLNAWEKLFVYISPRRLFQVLFPLYIPLADELEIESGNPNFQLIADYGYWFWNGR